MNKYFFYVKGGGFLSTFKCYLLYLLHNLYFLTKKYCYEKYLFIINECFNTLLLFL